MTRHTPLSRRRLGANLCLALVTAAAVVFCPTGCCAWVAAPCCSSLTFRQRQWQQQQQQQCRPCGRTNNRGVDVGVAMSSSSSSSSSIGSLHGQNSCFLPLQQLDQDYYAPRIVQIAGAYPGLTSSDFYAVTSEPAAPQGQWTYDFSDPDGPQVGTVAIPGSNTVSSCVDPVVIIAEHFSIGVELPPAITDPVDLVVLVDRAKNKFAERKFLVFELDGTSTATTTSTDDGDSKVRIAAFETKADMPPNCKILGQVDLVQIPWLPSMKPTKSGFLEVDEYF